MSKKNALVVAAFVLGMTFLGAHLVRSFTEPTTLPPGNNVLPPLNVGPTGQEKEGGLVINTNGAPLGLIVALGNVGIGTTNPGHKLHVQKNNDVIRLQAEDTSSLYEGILFYESDGTTRIGGIRAHTSAVQGSPNSIEIWGDSGPVIFTGGRNVELSGQIKISGGAPGAGKVLTSNAAGLATWETAAGGGAPSGPAGGDLTGTYPNPTIAANAVALTTDTTGNYVAGLTAGAGISVSGTAGEGWSPTVAIADNGVTTVKIAADAVTSAKIANGTIVFADWASNSCTSGQVPKWNGTAWACAGDDTGSSFWLASGSDIYNSNSANVGIGTAGAASSKLQVKNGADEIFRLTRAASPDKHAIFKVGTDGVLVLNVNGSDALFVKGGSGAIGIGAAPSGSIKLQVAGTGDVADIAGETSLDSLKVRSGTRLNVNGTATYGLIVQSGNVGIGITTPSKMLEVSGGIAIDTNTLYVDEVNNRVGIGTTDLLSPLNVKGGNITIDVRIPGGLLATRRLEFYRSPSPSGYIEYDPNAARIVLSHNGASNGALTISPNPQGGTLVKFDDTNQTEDTLITDDVNLSYPRYSDNQTVDGVNGPSNNDGIIINQTTSCPNGYFVSAIRFVNVGGTNAAPRLTCSKL